MPAAAPARDGGSADAHEDEEAPTQRHVEAETATQPVVPDPAPTEPTAAAAAAEPTAAAASAELNASTLAVAEASVAVADATGAPPTRGGPAAAPQARPVHQGVGASSSAELVMQTARKQRAEYRALVGALVDAWEAEVPSGVLLALEPTAADARAPHALAGHRLERLNAAQRHYAQVFAREGLALED